MSDYLMRDQAPLNSEEWERIDKLVVEAASQQLVGRRVMPLYGPLGVGVQTISASGFSGTTPSVIDLWGEAESETVQVSARKHLTIPIIYKDFRLFWRDIETSRKLGIPLDIGAAAIASSFCARAEDELIFKGSEVYGYKGLLNAEGRNTVALSDWTAAGNAFGDVVAAARALNSAGFPGPYAIVVSPLLYSQTLRVYGNTGVLELSHIQNLTAGGVYQSPALEENQGVVLAVGPQNLDLALSQDLTTAYLSPDRMNHVFRTFESLILRVKQPGAICTFEASKKGR